MPSFINQPRSRNQVGNFRGLCLFSGTPFSRGPASLAHVGAICFGSWLDPGKEFVEWKEFYSFVPGGARELEGWETGLKHEIFSVPWLAVLRFP